MKVHKSQGKRSSSKTIEALQSDLKASKQTLRDTQLQQEAQRSALKEQIESAKANLRTPQDTAEGFGATAGDCAGVAPRLARALSETSSISKSLGGLAVAALWSSVQPPLACADRARKVLKAWGVGADGKTKASELEMAVLYAAATDEVLRLSYVELVASLLERRALSPATPPPSTAQRRRSITSASRRFASGVDSRSFMQRRQAAHDPSIHRGPGHEAGCAACHPPQRAASRS